MIIFTLSGIREFLSFSFVTGMANSYGEGRGGTWDTLPHLEVNYGVIPDMQLHSLVPMAYSDFNNGDVEKHLLWL